MDKTVVVIGAGGHASVIADALLSAKIPVRGFVCLLREGDPRSLFDLPIWDENEFLTRHAPGSFLLANGIGGIGNSIHHREILARRRIQQDLESLGWEFTQVIHPRALISPTARLGPGVQILGNAVIQPLARIGDGCIVNTSAVVEHHVEMGPYCHVAPGALLCGNAELGAEVHIGACAVVGQGRKLGDRVVVGIGAAVTRDWQQGTVSGVPARPHEHIAP